jgi:hypothetical protein
MREIIFRGKRIDNGEWVYGTVEFHLIDGDLTKTKQRALISYEDMDVIGKVYRYAFEVIPETVGQFTGFYDRTKEPIYEGDILNAGDRFVCVVWHEKAGQWDSQFIKYNGGLSTNGIRNQEWQYRVEVIGNIYESEDNK